LTAPTSSHEHCRTARRACVDSHHHTCAVQEGPALFARDRAHTLLGGWTGDALPAERPKDWGEILAMSSKTREQ
jgi:hypothetical protein